MVPRLRVPLASPRVLRETRDTASKVFDASGMLSMEGVRELVRQTPRSNRDYRQTPCSDRDYNEPNAGGGKASWQVRAERHEQAMRARADDKKEDSASDFDNDPLGGF